MSSNGTGDVLAVFENFDSYEAKPFKSHCHYVFTKWDQKAETYACARARHYLPLGLVQRS